MPIIYDPDFDIDDFLDSMERRRAKPRADVVDTVYYENDDAAEGSQYRH